MPITPIISQLATIFAIILFSCGLDVEDATPPSKPIWIQKSLPEEWPERGIDAHESGGIYLEWESSQSENIIAYTIYRATWFDVNDSLGEYESLAQVDTESAENTEYLDQSAELRIRYYYKLKSTNSADSQSAFSDSVHYMLIPSISVQSLNPNGVLDTLGAERSLSWAWNYHNEMQDYILTIVTLNGELVYRIMLQPGSYDGSGEEWIIPDSIQFEVDTRYLWRIDTGGDYIDNREMTGSESPWATFMVADVNN